MMSIIEIKFEPDHSKKFFRVLAIIILFTLNIDLQITTMLIFLQLHPRPIRTFTGDQHGDEANLDKSLKILRNLV